MNCLEISGKKNAGRHTADNRLLRQFKNKETC